MQNPMSLYIYIYIYTNAKPNPNKCCNRKTGLSKKLNSSNALYLMETMKLLMKFQRSFEFSLFTQRFQRSFLSSMCSHFLPQAPSLSLSLYVNSSLCSIIISGFFFSFIFFIILTKVYISLCANFSFSFDSLIWNTNGFVSIYEFCNFNSLIFIDFHSFLSPLSNVYVHKHGLQASSSKGNLLHSSSEKLEK